MNYELPFTFELDNEKIFTITKEYTVINHKNERISQSVKVFVKYLMDEMKLNENILKLAKVRAENLDLKIKKIEMENKYLHIIISNNKKGL